MMGNDLSLLKVVVALFVTLLIYPLKNSIYNLCFHPLARFPGPKLAAISNAPYCYWFLGGRQPYKVLDLHRKYGPVVRVAPNELSFNTAQSWSNIYDFRPGHRTFIKSEFYEGGSFADQYGSIVSERDPTTHGKMRKYLSNAFSQRSLVEQEFIISGVTDRFIERIGELGVDGLDIVKWFNMMTFDIIGDLAFGENFGGIESGEIHPWISRITGAMTQGALADCFKRFPSLAILAKLMPGTIEKIIADTKINERYAVDLVKERIARKTDRNDFLTRIIENIESDGLTDVQIAAHASDFVLAGSETTATALSTITYYLLHTPVVLKRLQGEILESFKSYDKINSASTSTLKYLHAVILEGMRMYPPLPFALPRIVPVGGDIVNGSFLPAGTIVSTNPVAAGLDEANFRNPFLFSPERWLDNPQEDNLAASQPFSLGPRGCLGRSLGWMEMKTTLAKLYFKYELELVDKGLDWHKASKMHTLWQKPPLLVRVLPRAGVNS